MATKTEEKPPQSEEKEKEKEVVELGDSRKVFVGRDSQGLVRTFRMDAILKEGIHYNKISGKAQINSGGCALANQVANINLIKPQNTIVDGTERPNPYVERDPESRGTEMVWTRTVGIGFAPTGNLVLVDKSLVFNVHTYYVQDLMAKIKKYPACGTMGRKGRPPESWKGVETTWKTSPKGKRYPEEKPIVVKPGDDADLAFIQTRRVGETVLGLWIDLTHPEIQAAGNDDIQRQKFADRQAETIVSRNVLKSHPAIAMNDISDKLELGPDGKETGRAIVRVYGYKHDLGLKEIRSVADAIQDGDLDKAQQVVGASITIIADEEPEEPNLEEVAQTAAEVAAEDEAEEKKKKKDGEKKTEPKAEPPAAGNDGISYKDKLEKVARGGKVSPPDIVALALSLGYKVTLYTELTEVQSSDVYHHLENSGAV